MTEFNPPPVPAESDERLEPEASEGYQDKITALARELKEAHPEWPDLEWHMYATAHETEADMRRLAGYIKKIKPQVVVLEDVDSSGSMTEFFQRLADADPDEATGVVDDEIAAFARRGIAVGDTAVEAEMRAIAGTGVVVGHIDLNPGSNPDDAELSANLKTALPLNNRGTFDDCLDSLLEREREFVTLQLKREYRRFENLEPELERIFRKRPELLDGDKLVMVDVFGARHTTAYDYGQRAGFDMKREFSETTHQLDHLGEVRQSLTSGTEPSRELLAKAYLSGMWSQSFDAYVTDKEGLRTSDKRKYIRRVVDAFTPEDAASIYHDVGTAYMDLESAGSLLEYKHLGAFPRSTQEVCAAVEGWERAEAAESQAKVDQAQVASDGRKAEEAAALLRQEEQIQQMRDWLDHFGGYNKE